MSRRSGVGYSILNQIRVGRGASVVRERRKSIRESRKKDVGKLFGSVRARSSGAVMGTAGEPLPLRRDLPRICLLSSAVVPVHRRVDNQRSFHGCDRGNHIEGEGTGGSPPG